MFQMLGVFAEFERCMIRERVNAGCGGVGKGSCFSTQLEPGRASKLDPLKNIVVECTMFIFLP
jgi:hypothetical protein